MKIIYYTILICINFFVNSTVIAAAAASKSGSSEMIVTATVQKYCTIKSTPFSFSDRQKNSLTAQATVTVTCTNGTPYYLSVSQIDNAIVDRDNDILVYSVYQNAQKSQVLGNTMNKNVISGVGTGLPENLTLYAVIKSDQPIAPGNYEGKLHVTLSF